MFAPMPPAPFSAHYAVRPEQTVVTVTGEIDVTTAEELRTTGLEACRRATRRLELDVRGVTFVDSTGLVAILAIFKQAGSDALDFRVRCGSGESPVCELLRLVGLETDLGTYLDADS